MSELEELRLAYAECSRQKNELLTKHKQYAEMIHTCGPTCMKAACYNRRLRDAAQGALKSLNIYLVLTCVGGSAYDPEAAEDTVYDAIDQLRAALGEKV